jgi:hypothetical protein
MNEEVLVQTQASTVSISVVEMTLNVDFADGKSLHVNYIRLLSTVHTAGDEEVLRLRF